MDASDSRSRTKPFATFQPRRGEITRGILRELGNLLACGLRRRGEITRGILRELGNLLACGLRRRGEEGGYLSSTSISTHKTPSGYTSDEHSDGPPVI